MSDIYEMINSLGFEEAEVNKLKFYLVTNHEIRKELHLALTNSCKTEESKHNLLKEFLHNIHGMLDKIFAVILFAKLRLNLFCSLSRACGFRQTSW